MFAESLGGVCMLFVDNEGNMRCWRVHWGFFQPVFESVVTNALVGVFYLHVLLLKLSKTINPCTVNNHVCLMSRSRWCGNSSLAARFLPFLPLFRAKTRGFLFCYVNRIQKKPISKGKSHPFRTCFCCPENNTYTLPKCTKSSNQQTKAQQERRKP